MFREDDNHVAVFIDWDNLAISTAADFAGAVPDTRAIIQVAQRYGTVLLARAYAEWQVSADRLSVYRAGVDPVYAPTFRFEPDVANQPSRGKSLADPCLVADAIDALHLMPTLNVFVLVSGDKDLIPVVRLAQLRGKRVVVVGPDYVAAILKDMADEYVSYRSLIEVAETPATAEPVAVPPPAVRRRRQVGSRSPAAGVAPPAPAAPVARTGAGSAATPDVAQPARPATAGPVPAEVEPPSSDGVEAPVVPVVRRGETLAQRREATADELKSLFVVIDDVMRERHGQGRARLRATNLKDLLLARVSGFSERHYGFARFKDLLGAAERAGVLEVTRHGPVHWVSLPRDRDDEEAEAAQPTAPVGNTLLPTLTPPDAPAPMLASDEQVDETIRYIGDLSTRSRWLTYTYVLTNLISHLAQSMSPQAAETEARNVLSRMVQLNVLRIDREPREIEVGGVKHRVRMCHLEEEDPRVQSILAAKADPEDRSPEEPAEAEPVVVGQEGLGQPGGSEAEAGSASDASRDLLREVADVLAGRRRETTEDVSFTPPEEASPQPADTPESVGVADSSQSSEIGKSASDSEPRGASDVSPNAESQGTMSDGVRPDERAPRTSSTEEHSQQGWKGETSDQLAQSHSAEQVGQFDGFASLTSPLPSSESAAPSTQQQGATSQPEATEGATPRDEVVVEPATGDADVVPEADAIEDRVEPDRSSVEVGPGNESDSEQSLSAAYAALRQVVSEATNPARPMAGAASIKNRLGRRMSGFSERDYGFSKFKDFLRAAEGAGYVKVESAGAATRVGMPESDPEEQQERSE